MLNIQNSDYINILGSFLFLVVALLFLYQTKRRNRDTPTLTIGFFIAFFGQFFSSITLILYSNNFISQIHTYELQIIFLTATNIILVFFWIFLEFTNSARINTKLIILVSSLGTLYLSSYYLGLIFGNLNSSAIIGDLVFTVLINLITIRSIYILFKVYQATGKEKIALSQFIAFVLIEIWAFIGLINHIISFGNQFLFVNINQLNIQSTSDVLYYLGLLIFILTILINPDYIYRLPLNIQDIVILSEIGTAVYGIGANASEKSLDQQLLAGFITAANGFVQEMQPYNEYEFLQVMKSSNRILRIEFGKKLGVCLVSAKESWYLHKSIRNFVEFLEKQHPEELLDKGLFFDDPVIREWLKIYFPYLQIDKMQTY